MIKQNLLKLAVLVILLIFSAGCAKRVLFNYDEVRPNSLVKIKTSSGKSCEGIIQSKKPSFLVMQLDKDNKKSAKISRKNISVISGREHYVLDSQNKIISEWEIENKKNNNNLL